MVPVKPSCHKVLVKVELPPEIQRMKNSNIAMPVDMEAQYKGAGVTGTVMAIGPTAFVDDYTDNYKEPFYNVGDRVIIAAYSGRNFEHEGETYRLINDRDVHGIIVDPNFQIKD